jgi:hypothetical protein
MALVEEAAQSRLPVDVRALEVSADRSPVPDSVSEYFRGALCERVTGSARLSAFTDGARDYLTLTFTKTADGYDGSELGRSLTLDEIEITIDAAQPEVGMKNGIVIMAIRGITP